MPKTLPRPAAAADVAQVLTVICSRRPRKDLPLDRLRDRVLFETAYVCGARASEVCGLYVEDLDLRLDDEHVRICGKGGSVRTVLLDDRGYVALLKLYLARAGYTAGPLFRASINGRGGPLSYDAAHHRWQGYQLRRGVHRGRPPPPRPRLHRDHPAATDDKPLRAIAPSCHQRTSEMGSLDCPRLLRGPLGVCSSTEVETPCHVDGRIGEFRSGRPHRCYGRVTNCWRKFRALSLSVRYVTLVA
ncbi:tyrosine-type recombinase/integrase [Nonomuraea sp. M3C6]|uniref:Tyrosine-type recombinase/integrase n=1 Tax=Nonomuraea marmarensis TaxID=3351344 RepID=A0ABW7A809_9ACTN